MRRSLLGQDRFVGTCNLSYEAGASSTHLCDEKSVHEAIDGLLGVYTVCEEFQVATGTAAVAMGPQPAGYADSTHQGYCITPELPTSERTDTLRALADELRLESRRLSKIADRLEGTLGDDATSSQS